MNDLHIISGQTVALPATAYQARHFIDGVAQDSADGRRSDRISPSHGVVVSQAALGSAVEAEA
ncbi:MAG: sorbosone dehydrogenase, partial [Rhodobacterales bacterium]